MISIVKEALITTGALRIIRRAGRLASSETFLQRFPPSVNGKVICSRMVMRQTALHAEQFGLAVDAGAEHAVDDDPAVRT